MLKRIAAILTLGLFMASCNQVARQQTESQEVNQIAELVSEPLAFDGQEVIIQGIITHICKHGGDKIRVNQTDDNNYSIMVMLGDFQTQFDPSCEGRQIKITGVLKTMVRNPDQVEAAHHEHQGEEGHVCASSEEAAKKLMEKGITPDIRAFIEMKSFEYIEVSNHQSVCCPKKGSTGELAKVKKD